MRNAVAVAGLACVGVVGSCGGSAQVDTATEAPISMKVQVADPSKWPKDDRSMCNWKGKPELEVTESNGPGALKPNVRRVYQTVGEGEGKHKALVCREMDTNLDGIKDIVRTFNTKGEAVHEEADTNFDGKIDTWVAFVNGRMSEEKVDSHYTGRVDVWKTYVDGELTKIRRDTNGDGKPDVWEVYVHGKLDRMGVDTDSDGHVDRWDRDEIAKRAAEEAEIKEREAYAAAHPPDAGHDAGPTDKSKKKGKPEKVYATPIIQ